MAIGDLSAFSIKIGDLDLLKTDGVTLASVNIIEDIQSPTGPFADLTVIDASNAFDRYKISGNESAPISFTSADFPNESVSFDFSVMQGVDYRHGSFEKDGGGGGSMYYKKCTVKLCSPEFISAQGNYVNKEYEDQCSGIVQKIVSDYFKSSKSVDTPDATKYPRRMIARYEHPIKFLNRVIDDSISQSHESSLYVLYSTRKSGGQKFVYETYENAFSRSSNVTLKMRNTLKTSVATYDDKINSIMWFSGDSVFYRPSRVQNKAFYVTYNMATGEVQNPLSDGNVPDIETPFNVLGQYVYTSAPPDTSGVPVFVTISAENNPYEFELAKAKTYRLAFQSHLAQNELTFEVVGNPAIKLGSTVNLVIPAMVGGDNSTEQQLAGKFLITHIHHKLNAINQTPGYTMVLKGVKAAFNSQNGGSG
jgi:hypothetical protein